LNAIADTGFLVAFANRRDEHHAWAVGLAREASTPLLTCDAVLAEAAYHLGDSALVLAMVRDGLVTVAFDTMANLPRLTALALRYADRRPDLADLCLIRMSELFPNHTVVTVDKKDFRVYRRNRRDVIPIACP
jgi:predicted nucleic acid-binding protein